MILTPGRDEKLMRCVRQRGVGIDEDIVIEEGRVIGDMLILSDGFAIHCKVTLGQGGHSAAIWRVRSDEVHIKSRSLHRNNLSTAIHPRADFLAHP